MWLNTQNEQDPYNRLGTSSQAPNTSVGAGGGTASPGGSTSAGTAASATSTNPSTATPGQTNGPTQNFATVQDYLGANKTQGEDLGQKFTGSLDASANKQKNDITSATQKTQNDISAGTTAYNAGLTNTALTDPTKVTSNPDQLNAFLGQWNASYKGPSSFESSSNYDTAVKAANEAGEKAAQVKTTGGQQQLIQDQFGVYGQGNKGLDQAVLQNSTYYPKVQESASKFKSVQDYLGNQSKSVNDAAAQAKATTDATRTNTQNLFANNASKFQADINAKTEAARNAAATQAAKFKQDMASGDPARVIASLKQANPNVDAATIQSYLTAMNAQNGTPTDLSKFYDFNPATAVTASNAATAEDYAKADAYGKLTGVDYKGILNPAEAAKAGTAPSAVSGFKKDNVGDYLRTQYANALLTNGGGRPVDPGSPATPGVPGIPDKPAAGATFTSRLGINGLDKVAIPTNATPETVKTLTSVFNSPLNGSGTYKEGAVYDAASRVQQLQGLLKNGQLDQATFDQYTKPIVDMVKNYGGTGATGQARQAYIKAKKEFENSTGMSTR